MYESSSTEEKKMFPLLSSTGKLILFSCAFSVSLTLIRMAYSGTLMFGWLNWNLFLAFVPFYITSQLAGQPALQIKSPRFVLLFLSWLVFIPNSFYLITDLFHLHPRMPVPLWFDLALIISFVWNGIFLGVLSVAQMEKILHAKFRWKTNLAFIVSIMSLNSFGIYVGRYLRYNSWDVLTNPFELFNDILYLLIHPIRNRSDWYMIICYAVLMSIIYLGFNHRERKDVVMKKT